jgi:hypothetical protein
MGSFIVLDAGPAWSPSTHCIEARPPASAECDELQKYGPKRRNRGMGGAAPGGIEVNIALASNKLKEFSNIFEKPLKF